MKKILSIFLALVMVLSMVTLAVPASAAETSSTATLDPNKVGNTVITDADRAEYIEKLRNEGYKELDYAQAVAGLEDNGKYFLAGDFDFTQHEVVNNNLPYSSNADDTDPLKLGNNHKTAVENVTIDGCGYALTLNKPLFTYSANVTVKNVTFKGIIDSYKISKDGGAFSVISLWNHWGYCNFENVTSEVTVTTTNHSIEGRANDAQKLAALAINATDSTFKNVKVMGNHIAEDVSDNLVGVGAFVGTTSGKCVFENCISAGSTMIKSKKLKNVGGIGAFVGHAKGSVEFKNCVNDRTITIDSKCAMSFDLYVGAFAGKVEGDASFDRCSTNSIILANGSVTENVSAVGGLAGFVGGKATVKNCSNTGKLTFGAKTAFQGEEGIVYREAYVGGLLGHVMGGVDMTSGILKGEVTVGSTATGFGGLVGFMSEKNVSTFTDCSNEGHVKFAQGASLGQPKDIGVGFGGLIGLSKDADLTLINCKNMNSIEINMPSCLGAAGIGGIVGYQYVSAAKSLVLDRCVNYGDVICDGGFNPCMGGICGAVRGVVDVAFSACANEGDVKHVAAGKGWATIGGIVGLYGDCGNWMAADKSIPTTLDVYCCTNKGEITSAGPAGGILGSNNEIDHQYNTMTFFSCYNTGAVKSIDNANRAGGIIGEAYGRGDLTISNSVNEANAAGKYAGGIVATAVNGDRTFNNLAINNCKNSGQIDGVAYAGGIAASINATATLTVESCYNSGAVATSGAAGDSPIAGGVLGYTTKVPAKINNCVNSGKVTCELDTNESAVVHSKVVVDAECANYYVDGVVSGGTVAHASAKSAAEINAIVGAMNFFRTSNPYMLDISIRSANELIDGDYTPDTWAKVATAIAAAKTISATFTSSQEQIDKAKTDLDAAVNGLVIDKVDYAGYEAVLAEFKKLNKGDWSSTTWLQLDNSVKDAEAMKLEEGVKQSDFDAAVELIKLNITKLEEKGETGGQIDVGALGTLNTGGTLRPAQTESSTDTSTEAPSEEAPNDAEPVEESGCGGIIGGAAVVVAAVAAIGVGISIKKRED